MLVSCLQVQPGRMTRMHHVLAAYVNLVDMLHNFQWRPVVLCKPFITAPLLADAARL